MSASIEVTILFAGLAALMSVAMAIAWRIARRPGLSGWTDAIWSFATGGCGVAAALAPIGEPAGLRHFVVAGLVAVWALRLGMHISVRSADRVDDPRYLQLRRDWGANWSGRLFVFLQIQALCGWLLSISVYAAARNPAPYPATSDYAGLGLLAVAIIGEAVADRQLTAFRAVRNNEGKICTRGLWGLSRHPNYFFEWLSWLAYPIIAMGPDFELGWGWIALSAPVLMYLLLVHLSGIPPLEAHMLRTRGEAYAQVQRKVRAFWPIPRFGN